MPKYFDVSHNSPEWDMLRMGMPTSSKFDKILTPTGQLSSQADNYANLMIAELMMGKPIKEFEATYWTERGHEFEQEAREAYEMITGSSVEPAGFITDDKFRFGCSPDGLIKADNGGLEIKCPAPQTHIEYLLNKAFDKKYKPQYQGQMLIAQLDYVDFISYHPELPPAYFRIEPDLKFQESLWAELEKFHESLTAKIEKMKSLGHLIEPKKMPENPLMYIQA